MNSIQQSILPRIKPGEYFGDYRIIEEIGRGGMGVVYKAQQKGIDRPVALKVLLPTGLEDPVQRKRFLRESKISAKLQHPAIVKVYQAGFVDQLPFLALQFVSGNTLKDFTEENHSLSEKMRVYCGKE